MLHPIFQTLLRQHLSPLSDVERRYSEALAPIPTRREWTCAECGRPVEWGELFCSDGCADEDGDDADADRRLSLQRESEV